MEKQLMIRPANYCPAFIAFMLLPLFGGTQTAMAQVDLSGSDRTELIYFIGQVTNVAGRGGSVNLGEAHSLDATHPVTKEIQQVAIFRPLGTTITPIGVATVVEAGAVSSRVTADFKTKLQAQDIVVFVRQMDELMNPTLHEDYVLRSIAFRQKQVARRNSSERNATAQLLAAYSKAYPKWEMSRSKVSGHFFARPDLEMTSEVEQFLKQVNLFRKYHADGFLSVKAAGPDWVTAMGPLHGRANKIKHQSAIAAGKDGDDGTSTPFNATKLRKIVFENFFDSTDEEKATAAFLTATALRVQPRSLDQWLKTQFLQTQFPEWVDNQNTVDRIRAAVQKIESSN